MSRTMLERCVLLTLAIALMGVAGANPGGANVVDVLATHRFVSSLHLPAGQTVSAMLQYASPSHAQARWALAERSERLLRGIDGVASHAAMSAQSNDLPFSCYGLLPYLLDSSKLTTPTICQLWPGTIKTCLGDMLKNNFSGILEYVPMNYATVADPFISVMCSSINNVNCTTVFELLVNISSCGSPTLSGSCPNAQCDPSVGGNVCVPRLGPRAFEGVCSQCFKDILISAMPMVRAIAYYKVAPDNDTSLDPLSDISIARAFDLRDSLCVWAPGGQQRCVTALGFFQTPTATALNNLVQSVMSFQDVGDIPLIPSNISNSVCQSANNELCFNRIVNGLLAESYVIADLATRYCLRKYGDPLYCQSEQNKLLYKIKLWSVRSTQMCLRDNTKPSNGSYCLAEAYDSLQANPSLAACWNDAYTMVFAPANATCVSLVNQTAMSQWGCCAPYIMPAANQTVYQLRVYKSDYDAVIAQFPAPCAGAALTAPMTTYLYLPIPYSSLTGASVQQSRLQETLTTDLAAFLGVGPAYISVAFSAAAASSSARQFAVLQSPPAGSSSSATNASITIQTTSTTATQQAATQLQTASASSSGLPLPSTTFYLQSTGALAPGQELAVVATVPPPTTTTVATTVMPTAATAGPPATGPVPGGPPPPPGPPATGPVPGGPPPPAGPPATGSVPGGPPPPAGPPATGPSAPPAAAGPLTGTTNAPATTSAADSPANAARAAAEAEAAQLESEAQHNRTIIVSASGLGAVLIGVGVATIVIRRRAAARRRLTAAELGGPINAGGGMTNHLDQPLQERGAAV